MEPLIPQCKVPDDHETSFVIRDIFQDIFKSRTLPKNRVDNNEKNIASKDVYTAKQTNMVYNNNKLSVDDIGIVEQEIMYKHGKYLINQDCIAQDETVNEYFKLKEPNIFFDVGYKSAERFGLLQKIHLLPSKPEQSVDFRINSNQHKCNTECSDELDIYPSKLDVTTKTCSTRKRSVEHSQPEIFKPYPEFIVFYDYSINVRYKKRLKLKNISTETQTFIPSILSKTSCFSATLVSDCVRISPGENATFTVEFKSNVYRDTKETLTFKTLRGRDVHVKLISYRISPNWLVYVYKNVTSNMNLDFETFDGARSFALNSTIDCGQSLVGKATVVNLIIRNRGNAGQFFIMTEDNWFFNNCKDTSIDMKLSLNSFQIYPTYFEMDKNEYAKIEIMFTPFEYGLHIERLNILCNNCTYKQIEIIGDGVTFKKNYVCVDLNYEGGEHEMHLGECLPVSQQTATITVHNDCCVDLEYRWEFEKKRNRKTYKSHKINQSSIKINPPFGSLPPMSTTDYQITVFNNVATVGLQHIYLA